METAAATAKTGTDGFDLIFFSQLQRTSLEIIYTGQFSKHDHRVKKMSAVISFNNTCIEILTFGIFECKNYIFKFLTFIVQLE